MKNLDILNICYKNI